MADAAILLTVASLMQRSQTSHFLETFQWPLYNMDATSRSLEPIDHVDVEVSSIGSATRSSLVPRSHRRPLPTPESLLAFPSDRLLSG